MQIRNATREDMESALRKVNKTFGGNVQFKELRQDGQTKRGKAKWKVLLRVKRTGGPGTRQGFCRRKDGERRRLASACWHAHGLFFDSLPATATIRVSTEHDHRPGDPWLDRPIGSQFDPLRFSEACDCAERGMEFNPPGGIEESQKPRSYASYAP